MSFRRIAFVVGAVSLAAACGGSAFSRGEGEGGSSNAGASSSAGKPSIGGSSSSGGSASTGGASAVAGTVGVSGSGPICVGIPCAYPVCEDGVEPVTKPGECCPSCPPRQAGCEGVTCTPVMGCGEGYELSQPVGACCKGCVPKPGGVACREIACPPDDMCPLGYVRGDLLGGCCYDCVPDALFCQDASDCVTADRPRSCCGCPEAISRRMYDADECWSDLNKPRMIPQSCYPQVTCDAVCGMCPAPGPSVCANQRCELAQPK